MIAGEEAEVLRAATDHAIAVHGLQRTPDLEGEIRKTMKDEVPMQMSAGAPASQNLPKQ